MINKISKYIVSIVVILIVLMLYKLTTTQPDEMVLNQESDMKREVASTDNKVLNNPDNTKVTTLTQPTPTFENTNDETDHENNEQISPNDPISIILDKYSIRPNHKIKVQYDEWFYSNNYIQVPSQQYKKELGKVIESHNGMMIVEASSKNISDDFPPLAISYATNKPIPLTGNIFIKLKDFSELNTTMNFLLDDNGEVKALIAKIISDDKDLREINRIVVHPKKRGQVLILLDILSKYIDQYNIESVDPDNLPQFKY